MLKHCKKKIGLINVQEKKESENTEIRSSNGISTTLYEVHIETGKFSN
jgi:hypothetical protein